MDDIVLTSEEKKAPPSVERLQKRYYVRRERLVFYNYKTYIFWSNFTTRTLKSCLMIEVTLFMC